MAEQFWLGGFFIDLSRNQITHNNETITLPPKALAVLTYLAEHQGKVVSQNDLLDNIWQGTIVAPNTLQRCIAQLRKALGDDSKQQAIIRTHAKKGYSLECNVRWQTTDGSFSQSNGKALHVAEQAHSTEPDEVNDDVEPAENSVIAKPSSSSTRKLALGLLVLILVIVSVNFWQQSTQQFNFEVADIRPLTTTDNRELASTYSPDGKYIVFKRYPEILCVNSLWAKNTETQQEFQLTDNFSFYGRPAFSADGKTLAFVKEEDCRKPVTQKSCFQLQSIDFAAALNAPQSPETLLECNNTEIRSATWLNNDEIALMQKQSGRWQLISYSISNNKSSILYAPESGDVIAFDYSTEKQLIALTSKLQDDKFYIETLSSDGQHLSRQAIKYPQEIASFRPLYPRLAPSGELMVFSTGRQLFTLTFDGEINRVSVPLDQAMGTPVFHPDGKRLLAIKGYYDSDIVSMPRLQFATESRKNGGSTPAYTALYRSTHGEDLAVFQPGGDSIAFISNRSGTSQIWLATGDTLRQLSKFPLDTFISGFEWSGDGQSILVSAAYELIQFSLTGQSSSFSFTSPISNLFHWDKQAQTALAMAWVNGVKRFVELNLAEAGMRVINNKQVGWAQKSASGLLIYKDHMERYWQPGPAEDKLIPALVEQGSNLHAVIFENVIYGINRDFQLWSYDLDDASFNILADLPDTVDAITDINRESILLTMRIAARKDVVELTLK
ncbi:winged helix-turn-helix domain-containing protein [Planctobacterium marinum]|uniref:OmpR/PhoB-type domain-containing protein n=1 Tax=Planctobacterium marinum TaxID=1631968 RepID=A0AA48KW91_9ALTE|nr:hypothetical protein MACH26_38210 [Planctobacterium marinum]